MSSLPGAGSSGSSTNRPALKAIWLVCLPNRVKVEYAFPDRIFFEAEKAFNACREQRKKDGLDWGVYVGACWIEPDVQIDPRD